MWKNNQFDLKVMKAKNPSDFLVKASPFTRPFWVEFLLSPNRYDYNIIFVQEIQGQLNIEKLEAALSFLISSNPLMNAYLTEISDQLYWCINDSVNKLEILDVSCSIDDYCKKSFDLRCGWLYRFGLICKPNGRHVLVMVFHHAILDGSSYKQLIEDISFFYNTGGILNDIIFNYNEFNNFVDKHEKINHRLKYDYCSGLFWNELLKGMPPCNKFPRKLCQIRSKPHFEVKEICFNINKNAALDSVKKKLKTSYFNILMLCWGAVIARFCSSNAAHINYPVSIADGKSLGYLSNVNVLICPIKLSSETSLRSLVENMKSYVSQFNIEKGFKHRHLLTSEILCASKIKKLDQCFSEVSLKNDALQLDGCSASCLSSYNFGLAGSDILLQFYEEKEAYKFGLMYNSALFERSLIDALSYSFRYHVGELCENPERVLQKLPFSNELHYHHKRYADDDFYQNYIGPSIIDTMMSVFNSKRNLTAIIDKDEMLTYSELLEKSDFVTNYIRKYFDGCKTTPVVAVLMQKSIGSVVSMVGVLKSGASYLPIDPSLPLERKKYILENSQPSVLIIDDEGDMKSIVFSKRMVSYESIQGLAEKKVTLADSSILKHQEQDRIAYIIYTSGTTGNPKGVMVPHSCLLNFLRHQTKFFDFSDNECITLFHSLAFDASIEQILLAFSIGAKLLLVDVSAPKGEDDLLYELKKNKVTHIDMTPSFLGAYNFQEISTLRRVVTGGEPCTKNVIEQYKKILLVNEYGPTETTIASMQFTFRSSNFVDQESIIGKPIDNTKVYITDHEMNLVPDGVIGELCISGVGVSAGYLNEKALTNKFFVENPFVDLRKSRKYRRLYKTGDLVKKLPCGNIAFVSRNDSQIKLNGYRIELSEIESIAARNKKIQRAAAFLDTDNGAKKIILFYVSKTKISYDELIFSLGASLPSYMFPSACFRVDELPTTRNQKADYLQLHKLYKKQRNDHQELPVTDKEKNVCKIISTILNCENIYLNDTLSEIGINSILKIKILKSFEKFGYICTLSNIFKAHTVKMLSEYITVDKLKVCANSFPHIFIGNKFTSCSKKLFLFPAGKSGTECYVDNIVPHLESHIEPVLLSNAYEDWGSLSQFPKERLTFELLGKWYLDEIKKIQKKPPYSLFGWCFGGVMAFEVARQLQALDCEVQNLIMIDPYFNFKKNSGVVNEKKLPIKNYCLLNYRYSPTKFDLRARSILFKATKLEDERVLKEQLGIFSGDALYWLKKICEKYVNKLKYNGLNDIIPASTIEVLEMPETHSSWVSSSARVSFIANTINKQLYFDAIKAFSGECHDTA